MFYLMEIQRTNVSTRVTQGKEPPLRGNLMRERVLFGKNSLCPMINLVHYLRYIPCVEIVDVPSMKTSGKKPTHGTRSPIWAFEIL